MVALDPQAEPRIASHVVAYFSLEYTLDDLPFAGGLGVLAGDYLLECRKQNFPLIGVGLSYGRPPGLRDNLLLIESDFKEPYDADPETQIKKELFLAFEGVKKLKELGFKPDIYHLNEGHTAFVILADPAGKFVATKHTVLSASGLHIPKDLFFKCVRPDENLYKLGSDQNHPDFFSCNKFMLKHAARANGVSAKHCQVELEVHKNSPLFPITNGIFPDRWLATGTRRENKQKILDLAGLKQDLMTVVWARRLAEYKQPELLLEALPQLAGLPVQFIVAGHADPNDPAQQSVVERLEAHRSEKFAFLPRYDLETAKILTAGADVWLNTPVVGKEACGTSTMKAGLNGGLILSTPDGYLANETDYFKIENNDLVTPLQNLVALYTDPAARQARSDSIKNLILQKYTTSRMLEDYKNKLYNI